MVAYSLIFFFIFSIIIFFIGLCGLIISKKNNFILLICLEIMFIAANINFIFTSLFIDDIFGFMFVIFGLAISGAEISVGLAIFIILHRIRSIHIGSLITNLKN